MPVSEAQLETWARVGSTAQSQSTYATVRGALEAWDAPYASRSYGLFLQGSYANDTNVWADSDVDVVIRLDDTFYKDVTDLPVDQLSAYGSHYATATYSYSDFRSEVAAQLVKKFGSDVKTGGKAIFIPGSGSRRDADVLPAAQWRKYYAFRSAGDESYAEGIVFWAPDGTRIVNYPKQHSANCTAKHQATSGWFKPCVRILKNMRNAMADKGLIEGDLAPSYFLEGMLYNVPASVFAGSYVNAIAGAINWVKDSDRSKLLCANEMYYLVNPSSPVTWRAEKLDLYLRATIAFWNSQ